MIKANELRIGNYVYALKSTPEPIRIGNDYSIYLDRDYSPIPLTEEWLLNFGFEKNDHLIILTLNKCTFIELDNDGDFYNVFIKQYDTTDKSINDTIALDIELINVHQIQNLYFALEGEELELKPKK